MSMRPPPRIDESHPRTSRRVTNRSALMDAAAELLDLEALRARRLSLYRTRRRRRFAVQTVGVVLLLVVLGTAAARELWGIWILALALLVLSPLAFVRIPGPRNRP